jgi:altronate hydrolase
MDEAPPPGDKRLLRLHAADNVATGLVTLGPGEAADSAGHRFEVREKIPTGHKIAISGIDAGEKVIKYGFPIGTATQDIVPGEHVHVHNLRSNYFPHAEHEGDAFRGD